MQQRYCCIYVESTAAVSATATKDSNLRNIPDTIARLTTLRARQPLWGATNDKDRLSDLTGFGSNPGALRARVYVPAKLPEGAALVVVLHGCTQSATGYDHGSGWSLLAEQEGFAVLFPEQQRANNANLCFNWFVQETSDATAGKRYPYARWLRHWSSRTRSIESASLLRGFPREAP